MPRTRVVGSVLGGVAAIVVLTLAFGNPWFVDVTVRHEYYANHKIGPLVGALIFPGWRVSPVTVRALAPEDPSTLVLYGLVAALIAAAVRSLGPARRGFAVVVAGWWATVVAAAVAGLLRGLLLAAFEGNVPSEIIWQVTWDDLGGGLRFGLFFGWLAGLAVLIAARRTAAAPAGARRRSVPAERPGTAVSAARRRPVGAVSGLGSAAPSRRRAASAGCRPGVLPAASRTVWTARAVRLLDAAAHTGVAAPARDAALYQVVATARVAATVVRAVIARAGRGWPGTARRVRLGTAAPRAVDRRARGGDPARAGPHGRAVAGRHARVAFIAPDAGTSTGT